VKVEENFPKKKNFSRKREEYALNKKMKSPIKERIYPNCFKNAIWKNLNSHQNLKNFYLSERIFLKRKDLRQK
jgi:hypothetical protein